MCPYWEAASPASALLRKVCINVDADEEVDVSIIFEWLSFYKPEIDAFIGIREYEYVGNYFYFIGRFVLSALFRILFYKNIKIFFASKKKIKKLIKLKKFNNASHIAGFYSYINKI